MLNFRAVFCQIVNLQGGAPKNQLFIILFVARNSTYMGEITPVKPIYFRPFVLGLPMSLHELTIGSGALRL